MNLEKLSTDNLENSSKAFSALQLESKTKLSLKVNAILSYYKEFSKIKVENEDLNQFKESESETETEAEASSNKIGKVYGYLNKATSEIEFSTQEKKNLVLVAQGEYHRSRFLTGWDKLHIKTFSGANPIIQCWTAGFIEGLLSSKEIYYYYENIHVFFHGQKNVMDEIKKFYSKVDEKLKRVINEEAFEKLKNTSTENETLHWSYIACLHSQLNGLTEGYNLVADKNKKLTLLDFYLINSEGNFGDLKAFMKINDMKIDPNSKFNSPENLKKVYNMDNIDKIWKRILREGHCSAITKIVENDDGTLDMISGHNTWSEYCEMMRTLKFMDWAFEGNNQVVGMKPRKLNYSSYPGVLFSGDDFYELESKVVLLQTTLSALNRFIYKGILDVDKYIPEFIRIMTTNLISESGAEWAENYSSYVNHMYLTQWLVLDYKVLEKINKDRKASKENFLKESGNYKGLLYLVEEVPGSIKKEDMTEKLLKNKFYGSFNLAFYPEHQELLGLRSFGSDDFTSKEKNPRYYILEKLHDSVKNTEDFVHLIQYNGFHKKNPVLPDDPSYENPDDGISARSDLYNDFSSFSGGIDFKVVNKDLVDRLTVYAYGGPTYDKNPELTPFDFTKMTKTYYDEYHHGIPKVWKFSPFEFNEKNFNS